MTPETLPWPIPVGSEPTGINVYLKYDWLISELEKRCGFVPDDIKNALKDLDKEQRIS